jgi:hypothetical protein
MDIFPPAAQRAALLMLVKALGTRDSALRRDERGDWRVEGKKGHVYAIPGIVGANLPKPGFHFFVMGWSTAGWNKAKDALDFATLTNDGEDEGALFLDRLPAEAEIEALRHYVGLPKKRTVSEQELARLWATGFRAASLSPAAL